MKRTNRILVIWLVAALLGSTGLGHGVLLNDGPAQALSGGLPDSCGRLSARLVDLGRTLVVRPTAIAERVEPQRRPVTRHHDCQGLVNVTRKGCELGVFWT